jgi:hypothetical protein
MLVLKNPSLFPPEMGAWVRSQIVRNPTVKLDSFQLPSLDKKHMVGGTGEAPFQNGWGNLGVSGELAFFYMDISNCVHLQGTIKNGTVGAVAFTLPIGYRPLGNLIFPALVGGDVAGRVDVQANGGVAVIAAASTAYVTLNGISFRVA